MTLSRLQATCIVGHMLGFVILLLNFFSPYWVNVTQLPLVNNSTWRVLSIGPVFYLDQQQKQISGNFSSVLKLLKWNEFDGNLPKWANIARLLGGLSLVCQLTAMAAIVTACIRLKVTRFFFVQGIIASIAVLLSVVAYILFAVEMRDLDLACGRVSVFWSLAVSVCASVVTFVSTVLSFCVRETRPTKASEEDDALFAINSDSYRNVGYYPSTDPDLFTPTDYGTTSRSTGVLTNLL